MVFGPLAYKPKLDSVFGVGAGVFGVLIAATIILISALSALLYHWGVLQKIVASMAWVMMRTMRTSGSESLAGASNIFLGQTEAALLIKPYLPKMTKSELMALMVTGFSTIATGVMVVYAGLPAMSAGHIITASVLGAPAGLLMAKVMFPETEKSETGERHHFEVKRTAENSIDALCTGASEGVMLAINVIGMLLAFVAVVALVNALVSWPQHALGVGTPVTLQQFFGWLNAPFAWLLGVPAKDCGFIGQILGERVVLNEFVAYIDLSNHIQAHPGALDPRSVTLASYARELRALRFCQFRKHRDPDRRHRRAAPGAPRRPREARPEGHALRPARVLRDDDDRGGFDLSRHDSIAGTRRSGTQAGSLLVSVLDRAAPAGRMPACRTGWKPVSGLWRESR